jgi:hypothetical protein
MSHSSNAINYCAARVDCRIDDLYGQVKAELENLEEIYRYIYRRFIFVSFGPHALNGFSRLQKKSKDLLIPLLYYIIRVIHTNSFIANRRTRIAIGHWLCVS